MLRLNSNQTLREARYNETASFLAVPVPDFAGGVRRRSHGGAVPIQSLDQTLDHPFVYAFVDLERGIPLFLGTFEMP